MTGELLADGTLVSPHLRHVWRLSTPLGMFEHCRRSKPLPEHGFCTDDTARLVVLASRVHPDVTAQRLADRGVAFLEQAHRGHGRFSNRRGVDGSWLDDGQGVDCDDASGRAIWGLGAAISGLADHTLRDRAQRVFDDAVEFRSPWLRSTAFAALGAYEVFRVDQRHEGARRLLSDAVDQWDALSAPDAAAWRRRWPWPEERLRYANAVVPHMLLLAGEALGLSRVRRAGLALLHWLADVETSHQGWLSMTPVRGWAAGEPRPGFDQQPIEVATLADAAAAAAEIDNDRRWDQLVAECGHWFLGHNDVGTPMIDWTTGGGFDGLTPTGPNPNQGAESTLAAVTTMQHARRRMAPPRPAAAL